MRLILSTLLAVTISASPLVGGISVAPSSTDPASGVGIQLTDVLKSDADADPRATSYIVGTVQPGSSTQSKVAVTNPSAVAQTISLYTGAATISAGTFQGGANPSTNELTSWTSLSAKEITLQAGAKETVTVTIAVPPDAAPGERYGAVWAEVRGKPTADSAVIQASRAGIRMYVSVGGDNAAATDFTISSLTPSRTADGLPQVSALVANSGGRAIDATGTLMLTNGPSGLSAGPFSLTQAVTVAPGETQNSVFTLDKALPDGPWTAKVTLTSGLTERSTESTLTFPKATSNDTGTPPSTPDLWVIFGLIALGSILLVLIVIVLSRRAARRARDREDSGQISVHQESMKG